MGKINVVLLFGGVSDEHDISIMSAIAVNQAIDSDKYKVFPVAISKKGNWLTLEDSSRALEKGCIVEGNLNEGSILLRHAGRPHIVNIGMDKEPIPIDVLFPLLHGLYGEDGSIQGMCEFLGVPYVGAGILASAIGMDKDYMKKIFAMNRLPQTIYFPIDQATWSIKQGDIMDEILGKIAFPLFIKPASQGSSVGTAKAQDKQELFEGISQAFQFSEKVLVEEFVSARELECAVLGNDHPKVAGPGEIVHKREFYDYEAKYNVGESELILTPQLTPEQRTKAKDLALRAYKAIDCKGMARLDLFLTSRDELLINEINTIPGFTKFSMYPRLWENEGLSFKQLIDALLKLASEGKGF